MSNTKAGEAAPVFLPCTQNYKGESRVNKQLRSESLKAFALLSSRIILITIHYQ